MALWVFMAVIVIAVVWLLSRYNALVACKSRFKSAYAQVDALLKHRYEVVGSFVESATAGLSEQRQALDAVVRARDAAVSARSQAAVNPAHQGAMHQLSLAEAVLAGALGTLLIFVEAHPQLKSNQTIVQLTEELAGTDRKLALARRVYNDAVTEYNTMMKRFPGNVVALTFAFSTARLL